MARRAGQVGQRMVGLLAGLAGARGTLLPWAPVALALGIGGYFAAWSEPAMAHLAVAAFAALALGAVALRGHELAQVPALGLFLVLAGFVLAAGRAHMVAAPVLTFRYYGPVEGRIVDIDRSFSDQIRITLDRVILEDTRPERTPARVRIALHGESPFRPQPGMQVMLTAHLSPPDGPVAPGGFDFQRLAWFSRLGGVGYTRAPVMVVEQPGGGIGQWAFRLRMALSAGMQARMEGQAGAFAAAMMTGDRSGVTQATNDILRASNLSHMISISGLHMGMLTGIVFAMVRYGLALVPLLALRLNLKKLAAVAGLLAATFYMILAGPDVATRRSYIMAAVMLVAVLFDRRAISLRTVAIAALVCLVLEPESLIEPGFQMSFGATAALIVGFEHWARVQPYVPAPLRAPVVMVLSSLIAGLVTAPIAAAHFNRIAEYGLIANLLAVPVLGVFVMPAGVAAALLAPVGLAAPALWVMEKATALILYIAAEVAAMEGAVASVPAPPGLVLPLLGLGGAVLMLARGWAGRGAGAGAVILAFALWAGAARPDLLVAGDGTLAGVMTETGRAISKEKGGGFVAQSWLEDDGDLAEQAEAFQRLAFEGPKGARRTKLGPVPVLVFAGKGSAVQAAGACTGGAIIILSEDWQGAEPEDCLLFDRRKLRTTGAVALYPGEAGPVVVSARDWAGRRLWNERPSGRRRGDGGQ